MPSLARGNIFKIIAAAKMNTINLTFVFNGTYDSNWGSHARVKRSNIQQFGHHPQFVCRMPNANALFVYTQNGTKRKHL